MPKVSFKKPDASPSTAVVTPPTSAAAAAAAPPAAAADPIAAEVEQVQGQGSVTTAVAVRENTPPPAPYGPSADEIDMKDVKLPSLNIAQRVGELGEIFQPGTLVLEGTLELPAPIRLVVLGFAPKAFVEKVQGGGRGQICNTEQEVVDVGGTLDYNEAKQTGKALFQRLARALVFIEKPADVDPISFPYEFKGQHYTLAQWNLKGTSYTRGAKAIFTARKLGALRDDAKGGYRAAWWTLETDTDKFENNTYYIPKLRLAGFTDPEFRAWVQQIVGF